MFIYSFKASTLRFFAVLLLAATALVALIVFVPTYDSTASEAGVSISYDNVKTNEDRIKFLGQFGYNVSSEPIESVEVTLPDEFDRVFSGYNELQKAQGLDLSKYKNKQVMRYTYEVTNYPSAPQTKVWANVIVWRGKVIGGDICSADPSGFIHGFERAEE